MISAYREFSDIAPGETIEGVQDYSVSMDTTCLNAGKSIITFALDIASDGYVFWTDTFSIDIITTDIAYENVELPKKFSLSQNYPNPFNPSTAIGFQLLAVSDVELSIYNVLGEKIVTLVSEKLKAGYHQVEWDASGFASGVYFYRLQSGSIVKIKRMVLAK